MPRTALFLDIEPPHVDAANETYSQTDPHLSENARFRVGTRIGAGSFGVAYTVFDAYDPKGRRWVVKLPRQLVDREHESNALTVHQMVRSKREGLSEDALAAIREAFTQECDNAERILDPPYLRTLFPERKPGDGYQSLTPNQQSLLEEATHRWCMQPGYDHLHAILHFDPRVPMLLSERADGSLTALREQWPTAFDLIGRRDPPLWRDLIGRQLGAAVGFILSNTPLAHLDIKPGNILYTRYAPGVFRIQLSDFGMCSPKDEETSVIAPYAPFAFKGTEKYIPKVNSAGWAAPYPSNQTLSLFQYFATALGCLRSESQLQLAFIDQTQLGRLQVRLFAQRMSHIQTLRQRVNGQRGYALFSHAMDAVRSVAPELELIRLFRQLHRDLAIECECP